MSARDQRSRSEKEKRKGSKERTEIGINLFLPEGRRRKIRNFKPSIISTIIENYLFVRVYIYKYVEIFIRSIISFVNTPSHFFGRALV